MEDVFNVTEPVEIADLADVREQKFVIPPQANLKLEIVKVKADETEDKMTRNLVLTFEIVEGVPVTNPETGETDWMYQGMKIPQYGQRVTYWVSAEKVKAILADEKKKKSTKDWWKNQQYLVQFKYLLNACEIPLDLEPYKIAGGVNMDALMIDLKGKQIMANVTQKEEQAINKSTGQWVGLGTFVNEVKNFRKVQ